MQERTRNRLVSSDIWTRALFMVLFSFAYSIAKFIIVFLVIFQFFAVLFTGQANEPLLRFGRNLSTFIYEILDFQTFNTESRPFPFSSWPDEDPGGEEWLDEIDDEDAEPDDDAEDGVENSADSEDEPDPEK